MDIHNLESTKKMINSVFDQAKDGKVSIESSDLDNWAFYVKFYTKIAGEIDPNFDGKSPIINIPNFNNFANLVGKYLVAAKKFYKQDKDYFMLSTKGFEEKLFMDLFVNATNFDLNNIEQFLALKTKMLAADIEVGSLSFGQYQNCECVCTISKNHSNLEGTYKFSIKFIDTNNNEFLMPAVTFSVVDNTAYVFAVQRSVNHALNVEKSPVEKRLDRYFRKINKGVPDELQNISPNALVSFTIFCNYLKSRQITNIVAPDFMPIRYDAKMSSIFKSAKSAVEEQEMLEKHDKNQCNITNKFMDLLVRYNYHFENTEIDYDPNIQMMNMQLFVNQNAKCDDNIVYELSQICTPQPIEKQNITENTL